MRTKPNLLALFFISFLTLACLPFSPVHAEECGGGYGGNADGSGIGGFDGSAGAFTQNYQQTVLKTVQERGQAIFQTMSDADTIDAKADYCFDSMKLTFILIQSTSIHDLVAIAVAAALNIIIKALIGIACSAVKAEINQATGGALLMLISLFKDLSLCLPLPNLRLPGFNFFARWNRGSCQGAQLGLWQALNANTPANNTNVIWHLWNNKQQEE